LKMRTPSSFAEWFDVDWPNVSLATITDRDMALKASRTGREIGVRFMSVVRVSNGRKLRASRVGGWRGRIG
jgi:hypothetical protein